MRRQYPSKDSHLQRSSADKSGPTALLEAAAMSDGYLMPQKRSRPAAAADRNASASGKRRRVAKVDASKNDVDQDSTPSPKSRFLGVHWNKCKKKWRVRIKIVGRDTHVGYFSDEAEAALAFDRAIQKNNPDWRQDPSVSLNFPERAGEHMDSPGPDTRRWGAGVAQWASADLAMPCNHLGLVTPDCAGSGWSSAGGARSNSVGGEASTTTNAKITPFHARLMVASHHPIPSRSYYPGGLGMHGSGSDGDGSARSHSTSMGLMMHGDGKSAMTSNVSKLLDLNLKGLAEACSAHASTCSSPISLRAVLKREEADFSSGRPLGDHVLDARPKGMQAAKPSPSNLLSMCSTPAMPGGAQVQQHAFAPPLLCEGIELEALRGLVALADASAQCSRSEPSPVDSFSGFATPPPLFSSQSSWGEFEHGSISNGKGKKARTPVSHASTPTPFSNASTPTASTPTGGANGTAWSGFMQRSCASPRDATQYHQNSANGTAFKRIAKPQNQRQQHHHHLLGGLMNAHMGGHHAHPAAGGGSSSTDGVGARRAPSREGGNASRLHQSFRGVTWDKMKKMWRVRVCLAGGGREHVGYFINEKEGALAYLRAVERIKQGTYVSSSNKDLLPKDMKVSVAGLAAAEAAAGQMGIHLSH